MTNPDSPIHLIHPHLLRFDAYEAVEPPEALASKAGLPEDRIIKLNGNENPYGPSPKVFEALAQMDRVHVYPDPEQRAMRDALASYVGTTPDHIVVGNGSDEIIDLVFRSTLGPGAEIINCVPTFGMYVFTARICGATVTEVPRDSEFNIDIAKILASVTEKTKVVVIASPNNPTGNPASMTDIKALLRLDCLVVIDEAYQEFHIESAVALIDDFPNLVVLRTLSKWAGLAGLRIGYGIMNTRLAALIRRAKPPYSVSQVAEIALLASLRDVDTLMQRVETIVAERERIVTILPSIGPITPRPSSANFILCEFATGTAPQIYESLAAHGIFVRYFGQGILSDYLRISIGTREQMDNLLHVLTNSLRDIPTA